MYALHSRVLALSLFACAMSTIGHAQDGAVLRSAAVHITMTSPTTCEVTMALETPTSGDVDHRVEAAAGTDIELVAVRDAAQAGSDRQVGMTRSLVVRADAGKPYHVEYRVSQPDERAFRCPIWIPAVATDGRSREVTITVTLPGSSLPRGASFPAFSWNGAEGTTALGHLPGFVRVPYDARSTGSVAGPWDVAKAMDGVALVVFAAATAAWLWRKRRA